MSINRKCVCIALLQCGIVAAAFGADGTTPPPNPNLNNVFVAPPVGALTGNSSIVVAVHGFDSSPSVWATPMLSSILSNVPNDSWDGWAMDWSHDAVSMSNFGPTNTNIINAQLQGQYLAKMLITGGYTSIDLLGHSLGGRVIETAATIVSQTALHPTIDTTFFDPYTPFRWNLVYGSTSTYSQEIVNTSDYLNTNSYLANALDVDVTPAFTGTTYLEGHSWPYQWYQSTIDNYNPANPTYAGLGFNLSLTQGGGNWPAGNPARGTVDVMNKAGTAVASVTSTPASILQNALTVNPGAVGAVLAKSDNTEVGNNLISMHTSNNGNEWVNLALNITASADYIDFKFNFSTSEDGTLSMWLDNSLIWAGLDQYALTNQWEDSGLIMTKQLDAGQYVLSYRLDSGASDGGTSVQLQDIRAGLLTVPEPATRVLLLIAAPAISSARRRTQG